jgi:hypothetical protein
VSVEDQDYGTQIAELSAELNAANEACKIFQHGAVSFAQDRYALEQQLDAANQRNLDLQAECNETDRILAVRIAQLEAANQRIEELTAERDEAQFEADAYEKILDEIDRILMAPQQPTDKFTVILNSVKDVKAAKEAAEAKLATAQSIVSGLIPQADFDPSVPKNLGAMVDAIYDLGHDDAVQLLARYCGEGRKRVLLEVNEALAQIDAPIANDQRIVAEPLLGKLKSPAGTSDTEIVDWIEFFPLLRMLRLTDSLRLKDHPRSFRATVIEAMQAEKEPQP